MALDKFLVESEVVKLHRLNAPLLNIIRAMQDSWEGHSPKLFQPPPTAKPHNRPGKTRAGQQLVGTAAKAVDLLIVGAGLDRAAAGMRVYKAIKSARKGLTLSDPATLTHKTVLAWRDKLKADNPEMHRVAVEQFKKPLPPVAGETADSQVTWLLREITTGLILRM